MTEPRTMAAVVEANAARYGDKPMVIDPDARLSHAELNVGTRELSAALVTRGVGKGSRVGLLAPNSVDWLRLAVAVTRIGAVLVPLSTLLRPGELHTALRTAAVQFLIAVPEFRGNRFLDELPSLRSPDLPALQHIWDVAQVLDWPAEHESRADALAGAVRPSDPLVMLFTSGSSGPPKCVVHSHGSAYGAVRAGLSARRIDAGSRLYLPMPFFWVGGFGGGIVSTLAAGATLVTEAIPHPETTVELLRRERVTLFRGWPDQAERLARNLDAPLPDLQAGSLEALLPPELRGRPGARANLFGMTETFGPYCGYPADIDMPESAWGSCGKPFPGMEVRIVDPDSAGIGVIQVRGPHTLRGICRRNREEVFTVDGFYSTGDLGHLDGDGFLFYHGRADDMFKVSGATVYPSEVEAAVRTLPGVLGVHVTNIPVALGNQVGAVIVCEGTDLAELHVGARGKLSAFKVPTVWLLMRDDADIPRRASGKVDIPRLRELLVNRGEVV